MELITVEGASDGMNEVDLTKITFLPIHGINQNVQYGFRKSSINTGGKIW